MNDATNDNHTIPAPQRGCIASLSACGDLVIFRGPNGQEHRLYLPTSTPERVAAHWAGFIENAGLPTGTVVRRRDDVDAEIRANRLRARREASRCGYGTFGLSFAGHALLMVDGERVGDPIDLGSDRRPRRSETLELLADATRERPGARVVEIVWVEDVRERSHPEDDFEPVGDSHDSVIGRHVADLACTRI